MKVIVRRPGETVTIQPNGAPTTVVTVLEIKRGIVGMAIEGRQPPLWLKDRAEELVTLNDGSLLKIAALSIEPPIRVRLGFGASQSVRFAWSASSDWSPSSIGAKEP